MPSLRRGRALPPEAAATIDGPYPRQLPFPVLVERWRAWVTRRRLLFAGIAGAAYFAALLATTPAALLIARNERVAAVGGTVWHGQAILAGGSRLEWRWAPLRTVANMALAADFTVTGTDTTLGGRALLRRRSVRLDDVSGTADAGLLDALAPSLTFTCDMPLAVDLRQLELGGGDQRVSGRIVGEPGSCRPKAGGPGVAVPALAFDASHIGDASQGSIAPATQRRRSLVTFRLGEDGALTLAVTRDGAVTLPFAAPPAGLQIDTRL